jgi:hypothetical protein
LIDPHSDSWWLQGCNRAYRQKTAGPRRPLLGYLVSVTPRVLKDQDTGGFEESNMPLTVDCRLKFRFLHNFLA